jgi:deazaflavin-dependent oxidoreductase (nitroreductase family)
MSFDVSAGTRGPRPRGAPGPVGRRIQQWMVRQHRKKWKFMGMDLLFLTTVGRKTGQEHTNPVAWFPYGDGSWVIVASAGGSIQHPAWYRNLAANPDRIRIELAEGTIPVTAELLTGKARDEAWQRIVTAQPRFDGYQASTDRELPVIHLIPKARKPE